eukprot:m.22617 g.22617  ORF g.22617 m.22617 type:complete len:151 (+) comp3777_c0_seq1:717-1169(+)
MRPRKTRSRCTLCSTCSCRSGVPCEASCSLGNRVESLPFLSMTTPISVQLVVWLPALCRKMGVPYAIVKGKARLGAVVHKKTATALALTSVKKEDQASLNKIVETVNTNYLERYDEIKRHYGGSIMGAKTNARLARLAKIKAREVAAKMG